MRNQAGNFVERAKKRIDRRSVCLRGPCQITRKRGKFCSEAPVQLDHDQLNIPYLFSYHFVSMPLKGFSIKQKERPLLPLRTTNQEL